MKIEQAEEPVGISRNIFEHLVFKQHYVELAEEAMDPQQRDCLLLSDKAINISI